MSGGAPLYRGHEGVYDIEVDGERVGVVFAGFDTWTAVPRRDGRWKWTAPTRRQAVEQLINYLAARDGLPAARSKDSP